MPSSKTIKQNIINFTEEVVSYFNCFYKYVKKIITIVKDVNMCKEELVCNYGCNFY